MQGVCAHTLKITIPLFLFFKIVEGKTKPCNLNYRMFDEKIMFMITVTRS